jgi:hypothetical protein
LSLSFPLGPDIEPAPGKTALVVIVTVRSVLIDVVEAFSEEVRRDLLSREHYLLAQIGCTAQGDVARGGDNERALEQLSDLLKSVVKRG